MNHPKNYPPQQFAIQMATIPESHRGDQSVQNDYSDRVV
jgi:hypothetical protein